jgi:hypothetical protein
MKPESKQAFIRTKARQNRLDREMTRVVWSRHAIQELVADDLTRAQVERALQVCKVIEDYPVVHRPLPDCLVLGWLSTGEPIHAVLAVDVEQDRVLVITVYRPNVEEWENDWRTRRS